LCTPDSASAATIKHSSATIVVWLSGCTWERRTAHAMELIGSLPNGSQSTCQLAEQIEQDERLAKLTCCYP